MMRMEKIGADHRELDRWRNRPGGASVELDIGGRSRVGKGPDVTKVKVERHIPRKIHRGRKRKLIFRIVAGERRTAAKADEAAAARPEMQVFVQPVEPDSQPPPRR